MKCLVLSEGARRDVHRLPREAVARVTTAVDGLLADPRPPGCLLLKVRRPPTWRLRVGDYRVFYEIDDEAGIVTVTGVHRRDNAYRPRG